MLAVSIFGSLFCPPPPFSTFSGCVWSIFTALSHLLIYCLYLFLKPFCGCLKFYNKYFKLFLGYLQIIVNCFTCGVRILYSEILISTTCLPFPTHCYKTPYTIISNASSNTLFLSFQIYIRVLYLCHAPEKSAQK